MLDFNSRSALSDRINFLIDEAISAEVETPRQYLGASAIGHECERRVQFYWQSLNGLAPVKEFQPRIKRIFDRGNLYEERARQWLKNTGFLFGSVKNHPFNKFEDYDGLFRGHADGVITGWSQRGIDCPIQLPALWECKCLGSKGWRKLQDEKLKKYSATYFAQSQVYMHYLELPGCLFTAVNADTMEIYHEWIPFSQIDADMYLSRVQTVLTADYPLQKISQDRNFYVCKMCDFREVCHEN